MKNPVAWDEAPLGQYGMARWADGTEWPACRIVSSIPFIYAIVPARDRMQLPSVAEDQLPSQWRPFGSARERSFWETRTTRTFADKTPAEASA